MVKILRFVIIFIVNITLIKLVRITLRFSSVNHQTSCCAKNYYIIQLNYSTGNQFVLSVRACKTQTYIIHTCNKLTMSTASPNRGRRKTPRKPSLFIYEGKKGRQSSTFRTLPAKISPSHKYIHDVERE